MTDQPAGEISAADFDRVAEDCNWSTRSLSVVRALLVNGEPIAEVADRNEMSQSQARVLRTRFRDKAALAGLKKVTASDFMQTIKPDSDSLLKPFRRELLKLLRGGYSTDQLLEYLAQNGIETSAAILLNFLQKAAPNENRSHRKS